MTAALIFVTADEPLLVFESLDRALAYLEWQDVDDGLYLGYDSDGRLIEFGTEQMRVVADVEPDPTHADELRARLIRILGVPETTSLVDLQAEAVTRFGLT